jgi:ABC-type bacteriocin/lantibiotic exporter with double-glycine peptidase domain
VADYIRSAVHSGEAILSVRYKLENFQEINEEVGEEAISSCTDFSKEKNSKKTETIDIEEEYTKLRGHIRLENVSFGYSKQAGPVLNDISIDIPAGNSIALVGSSGCGKTTLKKLICGRYDPWEGEIFYDDKLRSDIPKPVLTNSIAAVDQQIIMFEDTVMNNIKMWDTTQLDADVILAAKDSEIYDEIILREGGFKSLIEEDGNNYSGGQRQRMEIARALSMEPTVLVLDEATSALDTIVEKRIVEHVRDRGITTIVVAHRLSTIRNCDCIYVMDHGSIIAKGTHDELMNSCEHYRRLVTVE